MTSYKRFSLKKEKKKWQTEPTLFLSPPDTIASFQFYNFLCTSAANLSILLLHRCFHSTHIFYLINNHSIALVTRFRKQLSFAFRVSRTFIDVCQAGPRKRKIKLHPRCCTLCSDASSPYSGTCMQMPTEIATACSIFSFLSFFLSFFLAIAESQIKI